MDASASDASFRCSTCNTTFPAKKEFIKHVRETHFK